VDGFGYGVQLERGDGDAPGNRGSDLLHVEGALMPEKKRKRTTRRANSKTVYDGAGKLVGKFSRKSAKMIARVVGGTVGKPKINPRKKNGPLLFKSRAAAVKYARTHGAKRFSVKKLARGR
jgi:hypothetical protein